MKTGQVFHFSGQVNGQVFLWNLTRKRQEKLKGYRKLVRLVRSNGRGEAFVAETLLFTLFSMVRLVRSFQKQNLTTTPENLTN